MEQTKTRPKRPQTFEMKRAFSFLKWHFELPPELALKFQPDLAHRGEYDPDDKVIAIRSTDFNPESLFVLLHEIGHVLQDVNGELEGYFDSFKKMWSLERDANLFAVKQYGRLYSEKYGQLAPVNFAVEKAKYLKEWNDQRQE
jgi:Zn-dependent peptidase ImmA (M78 family)